MQLRARVFATLICCVMSAVLACAEDAIKPGQLIQHVNTAAGFSYALYLPSSYTTQREWPVVFVLDPGGRGASAAERFIQGAEKFGYVVAASNDSRNGPIRMDAISAMVDDITGRVTLDKRRIYFSGMSGGARTAIYVANKCKDCAGVIAVGAGFSEEKSFDSKRLVFFGIAGLYDFNYPELLRNHRALQRQHATSRFESFDGDHQWAPAAELARAMAWLRLQEMARATAPSDPEFIGFAFEQDMTAARKLQNDGQSYRAYLAYQQIVADFASLHDTAGATTELQQLKDRPEVKNGEKVEREQLQAQQRMEAPVLKVLYDLESGTAEPANTLRAQALAADLRKSLEREKDSNRGVPLRRTLGNIRIVAFGASETTRRRKDYSGTAALYAIARETRPDSPELTYNVACAYALQGDKKKALRELQKAIELGFRDIDNMRADSDLESLRKEPEFQKLIASSSR